MDFLTLYKIFLILPILTVHGRPLNPTILQDSRDLPQVDGTFGFLYRTEDGIAHAAKGDSNGVIHGRFTYTDPTGLKVNFNYNAGSRVTPGYNYDATPLPRTEYQDNQEDSQDFRPVQSQHKYSSQIRQSYYEDDGIYQEPRRTRPPSGKNNELNEFY